MLLVLHAEYRPEQSASIKWTATLRSQRAGGPPFDHQRSHYATTEYRQALAARAVCPSASGATPALPQTDHPHAERNVQDWRWPQRPNWRADGQAPQYSYAGVQLSSLAALRTVCYGFSRWPLPPPTCCHENGGSPRQKVELAGASPTALPARVSILQDAATSGISYLPQAAEESFCTFRR